MVYADGDVGWYRNGVLHRDGAPAVVRNDGGWSWYQKGVEHRVGGPATFDGDRCYYWMQHGKLHNHNGPAFIELGRAARWYHHGVLHRHGGPAVIVNGRKMEWYHYGRRHRRSGPAVVQHNCIAWYTMGQAIPVPHEYFRIVNDMILALVDNEFDSPRDYEARFPAEVLGMQYLRDYTTDGVEFIAKM